MFAEVNGMQVDCLLTNSLSWIFFINSKSWNSSSCCRTEVTKELRSCSIHVMPLYNDGQIAIIFGPRDFWTILLRLSIDGTDIMKLFPYVVHDTGCYIEVSTNLDMTLLVASPRLASSFHHLNVDGNSFLLFVSLLR